MLTRRLLAEWVGKWAIRLLAVKAIRQAQSDPDRFLPPDLKAIPKLLPPHLPEGLLLWYPHREQRTDAPDYPAFRVSL